MIISRLSHLALKPRVLSNNILSQNILKPTLTKYLIKSNYSHKIDKNEDKLKIYHGALTPRMKAVKIFSLTTSLTGLLAQPILLEQGTKLGGTGMAIFICGFAGFFTFVTPLLLHAITKNYVTELFYNEKTDEYTAKTISLLLRQIETTFKTTDVKVPEVPGMFTSIEVGKTSLFLEPTQFTDTEHYVRIMGYDKPIDFKISSEVNDKNKGSSE